MEADAYTRLSKNRKGHKENCARQAREIQKAAVAVGDTIVRVGEDDNLSAWKRDVHRPAWEETIQRIRDGQVRKVWLWRFDRMMRQPWDLEELISVGEPRGLIIAATNGPPRDLSNYADRHYLRGEVAAACRYSDEISDKASAAHQAIAEAGHPHAGGRRPFGFQRVTGRRVPDPEEPGETMPGPPILEIDPVEAEVVREVYRKFLAGVPVYRIVGELERSEVSTVTGRPWTVASVRKILGSGPVAGVRIHKGRPVAEGTWAPIVPREQWEEVQRMLSERSSPAHAVRVEYLLSGLIVCGVCETRLRPLSGGSSRAPTYVCSTAERYRGCGKVTVQVGAADGFVSDVMADVLADPDAARPGEEHAAAVAEARVAAESARRLLAEIAEDYGAGRITREERDTSRAAPAAGLARAEELLERRQPRPDLVTQGRQWAQMETFEEKRAAVRAHVLRVVLAPAAGRGPVFDDRRILIHWR